MTRRTLPAPTLSLISVAEAAERLKVNPRTIRRRIADGTLRAYRLGPRQLRVDVADVDALAVAVPTLRDAR